MGAYGSEGVTLSVTDSMSEEYEIVTWICQRMKNVTRNDCKICDM